MEHIFKANGKIYQDPVFNIKKSKVSERFFCEGKYDELFNFNKEIYDIIKKNPDVSKHISVYKYNWEEDFIKDSKIINNFDLFLKYEEILFTSESLRKLSEIIECDNLITFFIFNKVNEFTKNCDVENFCPNYDHPYIKDHRNYGEEDTVIMNSINHFTLGSRMIDYIVKYNCVNTIKNIIKSSSFDLYEQCFESWENFFINGSEKLVVEVLKTNPHIFMKVRKGVISRVLEIEEETNFLKNIYSYYNLFNSYELLGITEEIHGNNIDIIFKLFKNVIKNCDKINVSNPIFEIFLVSMISCETNFVKIVNIIKYFKKYDTNMFLKINIETKNVKSIYKYVDINPEDVAESLKFISALVSIKN